MIAFIAFLANHYLFFLIVAIILAFALIGSLVEIKKDDSFTKTINLNDELEARRQEVAKSLDINLGAFPTNNVSVKENVETIEENIDDGSEIHDNSNIKEQFEMFAKESEKMEAEKNRDKKKKKKSQKK